MPFNKNSAGVPIKLEDMFTDRQNAAIEAVCREHMAELDADAASEDTIADAAKGHLVRLQTVHADEYCLARHQYRHNDGAQWSQASAADISLAERRLRGVE